MESSNNTANLESGDKQNTNTGDEDPSSLPVALHVQSFDVGKAPGPKTVIESNTSVELPKPSKQAKTDLKGPEFSFPQTSYISPFDEDFESISSSYLLKKTGNIFVFCRIRPVLPEEFKKDFNLASITSSDNKVINVHELVDADMNDTRKNKKEHRFSFDFVFPPSSTQQEIFHKISQLVLSATDGYNVSIFAYGQTGSGKTFTIEGPAVTLDSSYFQNESLLGMIPRSVQLIFKHIHHLEPRGWNYHVEASFLQIYNELIQDLLNPDTIYGNTGCEIIESSTKGDDILLTNVTFSPVTNTEEVFRLMKEALINRTEAATRHEYSSCSHYVFQLKIFGENSVTNEKCKGILNFVDLAGSEKFDDVGSAKDNSTETKVINKSLSNFENIMMALSKKESHVPFCDSKLTHLLAYSLGVNSKTLMFVNISPDSENLSETLNSLRFASKLVNHQPCEDHSIKPPVGILKLYNLSDNDDRRSFLDKLIKYQEDRGTPLTQCPIINKKPLDLYNLYLACKERGGFVEVTKNNYWNEIADTLGFESSSLANIIRMEYINHLLPFECEFDREDFDYESLISQESEFDKTHDSLIQMQEPLLKPKEDSSQESVHFRKGQNEPLKLSIKLILEDIDERNISEPKKNFYVHRLLDFLENPKISSNVCLVLFLIFDHLRQTDKNYLISFREDRKNSMPPSEQCIVSAIVEIDEKQKAICLIKNVLNNIHHIILSSKDVTAYGLASLCRVFIEICRLKNERKKALILCVELLKRKRRFSPYLISTMVVIWPDVFVSICSDSEDTMMLVRAISDAIRRKPNKMEKSLFLCSLDVIEEYFPYPPICDVTDALNLIKEKILKISIEDTDPWTLISTFVILTSFCSTDWINSNIIYDFILPNLEKYSSKTPNESCFALFCSLLVDLQHFSHNLPFNILKKYFNVKGNFVEDIAAVSVIKYLIRKRLPIQGSIAFWIETNIDKLLKDDDVSELYNRKQLYYGKGLKTVQDIYLIV